MKLNKKKIGFISTNFIICRNIRDDRSCLVNIPTENSYKVFDAGKTWSVDDQCKQKLGANASFCRVRA